MPHIHKLVQMALLYPMNTAVCERGFSEMNRIKSDGRSDTLSALMKVSIDAPDLGHFDPDPAIYCWLNKAQLTRIPGASKHASHKPWAKLTASSQSL
ncbi:hypothetical protein HOLleu_20709 [Holothuria leucospilota]|uniref:HAT C-terminal dimerisation domain-containing protein n=1 Tax=Holothuria leucospilota TaxID=206669 RepID=A0A9Q1C282_HOLLE|nr:hypothetical protein HOLleu_20709 [Holothuria leucospilota]